MRYVNNYITIASNSLSFHFQKHPHLRGENHPVTDSSEVLHRNIPTCVGKTAVPG